MLAFNATRDAAYNSRPISKREEVNPQSDIMSSPQSPSALNHTNSNVAPHSNNDDYIEPAGKILLQPETRPITQDQLVNEVKGIYASLVMVEKKCVEIDQQQSKTTNKLSDEQAVRQAVASADSTPSNPALRTP
jgi:hypothetical protein